MHQPLSQLQSQLHKHGMWCKYKYMQWISHLMKTHHRKHIQHLKWENVPLKIYIPLFSWLWSTSRVGSGSCLLLCTNLSAVTEDFYQSNAVLCSCSVQFISHVFSRWTVFTAGLMRLTWQQFVSVDSKPASAQIMFTSGFLFEWQSFNLQLWMPQWTVFTRTDFTIQSCF